MTFKEQENTLFGRILTFDMTMDTFPDHRLRTIRVWLPDEYDGHCRFPVLYLHDGQNLFDETNTPNNRWHVNWAMNDLCKESLPAIIVGIDNAATRMSELCPNLPVNPDIFDICQISRNPIVPSGHLYAKFIVEQLKPFIDQKFATIADQKHTAIGGSSMGGLMSLYMILEYPDIFSKAMVFSPNFVTFTHDILLKWIHQYDYEKQKDNRIFIFHGGIGLEATNWPLVQEVSSALEAHGFDNTHLALVYDSRQPHYETAWRKYFTEAFRFLFLKDNSESKYYQ